MDLLHLLQKTNINESDTQTNKQNIGYSQDYFKTSNTRASSPLDNTGNYIFIADVSSHLDPRFS